MLMAGEIMICKSYVLITAARNEEAFIEKTIQSVISQTILPKKWVIVSDGSTDRTDDIVKGYAVLHPWIELIRITDHYERQFAAKVNCFNAGYQRLKGLEYDIVGNMDADISFDRDYIEFLLNKFSQIPNLGVAGTPFVEDQRQVYNYNYTNIEHVSGACQLFRRNCFESIGGFVPISGGGEDWIAVTTARQLGWTTKTFIEKVFVHHRPIGSGSGNKFMSWFRLGNRDYCLGWHPLWEVFRVFYQMTKKPLFLGGILLFAGYAGAFLNRKERAVSLELMKFHREEQMKRLRRFFIKSVRLVLGYK